MTRSVLIDNHDSYTYNLYHLLAEVNGQTPTVVRNDAGDWAGILALQPDHIVISPGPGRPDNPKDFAVSLEVLRHAQVPVLGVCLGHQGLGVAFGATVQNATTIMHGLQSRIRHDGSALFANIPQNFLATRYHSLVVGNDLPEDLIPNAWADDGTLMGLRHRTRPLWGVQFHPESIATEHGHTLLKNFCAFGQQRPAQNNQSLRSPQAPNPHLKLHHERLAWHDPAHVFQHLFANHDHAFWLDSSRNDNDNRFSYMGAPHGPLGEILRFGSNDHTKILETLGQHLDALRLPNHDLPFAFQTGFVGYFGYELKNQTGGHHTHTSTHDDVQLMLANRVVVFDHAQHHTHLLELERHDDSQDHTNKHASPWFETVKTQLQQPTPPRPTPPNPTHIRWNSSLPKPNYQTAYTRIQDELRQGNTYEICLTMQLATNHWGFDPLGLYLHLRHSNPAPHGAYLHFGELHVLSCSPELFLRIDTDGHVLTKPIKGTAPRSQDPRTDAALRDALQHDPKNRAENLMIADLLRNDLGRIAKPGTVRVPKLMHVESHAGVHQLISDITAQRRDDASTLDCLHAVFPGGSMTGAPKERSLEIIDALEPCARGIYSGALGYLGLNGTTELSVVIRTLVVDNNSVSLGVGGAITVQSTLEDEHAECLLKAKGLLRAIGEYTGAGQSVDGQAV